MRWIRLLLALIRAKFKSKINASETSLLTFRIWLTDIDISITNHAAIMTIMETGRIDFMVRTNFFKVAAKNKWYIPLQAISVQFYRPLKLFQKGELTTKISYIDEEWIYLEHKIIRNNKEIATALLRGKIKKGRETVPPSKITKAINFSKVPGIKHDFIKAYENEILSMKSKSIQKKMAK